MNRRERDPDSGAQFHLERRSRRPDGNRPEDPRADRRPLMDNGRARIRTRFSFLSFRDLSTLGKNGLLIRRDIPRVIKPLSRSARRSVLLSIRTDLDLDGFARDSECDFEKRAFESVG